MTASIDDFIAYCSRWRPGFVERCRGASEQEIQELAWLAGVPLPKLHEDLLKLMGHGSEDLDLTTVGYYGSTDISEVIARYRRLVESIDKGLLKTAYPAQCILFERGDLEWDACVQVLPGGESRVIEATVFSALEPIADSFSKFLFQQAFTSFRFSPLSTAFYTSSYAGIGHKNVMGTARHVLEGLGFREEEFSDSISYCGERDDAVVRVSQGRDRGMVAFVSSQDVNIRDEVGASLTREIKGLCLGEMVAK